MGISLTTDAPPGSFSAVGLAAHQGDNGTSFTPVIFSDPKGAKTSTTVFPGLPVGSATLLPGGDYTPGLSVANFSSSPANVTVTYSRTTGDTPEVRTVANLVVPAGGTATTEIAGLRGDPDLQNSFEVVSDQAPGDVVSNVYSNSDTGIQRVELPGKDLENSHNSGNHPWTVADGTDSTILLFNETTAAENFTIRVTSGSTVWAKKYTLAALATKAIDINELIADQVKDDKGNVLTKSLRTGEASWFEAKQYGGTGRLLQSNPAEHAARSFSCGYFSVISGADFYPADTSEAVGQTNDVGELDPQVSLTESQYGCDGDPVGDDTDYLFDWSSSSTSIATISGSGGGYGDDSVSVQGVGSGTATIEGTVSDQYGCSAQGGGQMTVQGPNRILVTNDVTQTENCSLPSVARIITYTIEDSTGAPMDSAVPIHENVPVTTSSCNNSVVHTGSGCVLNLAYQPGVLNQFDDNLWAGCPTSASVEPCGFTFSNQQWQYCPGSQPASSIGTVGPVSVGNSIISVDGNIFSLGVCRA